MGSGAQEALTGPIPALDNRSVAVDDLDGVSIPAEPVNTHLGSKSKGGRHEGQHDEPVDDQRLVERCKKGDQKAFRILVERYQGRVYALALSMLHNRQDALDVSQEAFIKVHRYLGNFQGSASFYTWLYRITYNLCIDQLRRSGRMQSVDYDDKIQRETTTDPGNLQPKLSEGNPARTLQRRELAEKIQEAIDELPSYHKGVIIMREIEGMSYKEMAEVMQVSKGTIMSRLHHARQKLQKALTPYLEGELEVK
jgi:RNA polymerase sigma-70 factor (ECF subfamily)